MDQSPPPARPARRPRQNDADPFGSTVGPLVTGTSGSGSESESEAKPTPVPSSTKTGKDSSKTEESSQEDATETSLIPSPSAKASQTSDAIATFVTASASGGAPTALPSPFDTSLGSNFTSDSCPRFFDIFLNNGTFQDCHPISLLLQNSNSFFRASRSPESLADTLDAACAASVARCSPLMKYYGAEMIGDSACGQEYRDENPLVRQAYSGLVSYEPLYSATCIKSSETEDYCFVDAITNQTNPSDSYPYYIALGTDLPASTRPTCNKCLKDTMVVFAGYAAQKSQPVSKTYIDTASQVNSGCGAGYVNVTVPVATISAGTESYGSLGEASSLLAFMLGLVAVCLTL